MTVAMIVSSYEPIIKVIAIKNLYMETIQCNFHFCI